MPAKPSYRVLKHGHKVGHHQLVYGGVYTAADLEVSDDALTPWVDRGVLERLPILEAEDGGTSLFPADVSGPKSRRRGKNDD